MLPRAEDRANPCFIRRRPGESNSCPRRRLKPIPIPPHNGERRAGGGLAETTGMEADAVRGREEAGTRVADALPVALTSLPLFGGLGAEASAALEQELEWLSLLGGHSLFDEGDPSDALYVVISGVLGVVAGEGRARG